MNITDFLIILFFISALVRGIELGVVRQVCSTIALLGGFLLGVFIQGRLIQLTHTPASKALLALIVIIGTMSICASLGEYLGILLKRAIERSKLPFINTLDRLSGSVVAGMTLLLVVWLAAAIFNSAPVPGLQKQLKGSVIVGYLDKTLPPAPGIVSRLSHLMNPNDFPEVFTGLEPRIDTTKSLPSIGELDSAVQKVRESIVKIEGQGCGNISQGSGFVAGQGLVITNAHVIAGVARPTVLDAKGRHGSHVIWFDKDLDMAVLRVNGLAGPALSMESGMAATGTKSAIVGYPGGGDFAAYPAVVMEAFRAIGRDIYNQEKTTRQVYSLKGTVEPGNSGGPLIDKDGDVIGLIFAESTTYDDVGYALAMDQVIAHFAEASTRTQSVSTGTCTQ